LAQDLCATIYPGGTPIGLGARLMPTGLRAPVQPELFICGWRRPKPEPKSRRTRQAWPS
jgi:hypothetical protein